MIRALIFDCFGVLYTGSFSALRELCPDEKWSAAEDLNKQADYGYITRADYLVQMAELVGMTAADLDNLLMKRHVRNEQLISYIREQKLTYKIGLLSNVSDSLVDRLFTQQEIDDIFDVVVYSYQEHITKPNPEIFVRAALQLDCLPSECIMVDDLDENCEGAEEAGMHSVMHEQNTTTIAQITEIVGRQNA